MNLEKLIYEMLTENTGTHICDSGGQSSRMWQRNQKKSLEDFRNEDRCTMELSLWTNSEGKENIEATVDISVFHYLNEALELDEICNEFNNMPVDNWDADNFYGVSSEGEEYLLSIGETTADSWNTYNWCANFSQTMQGREIEINGAKYVVLQIHGGADVRGGYTDAKLFKISEYCEFFLNEMCNYVINSL